MSTHSNIRPDTRSEVMKYGGSLHMEEAVTRELALMERLDSASLFAEVDNTSFSSSSKIVPGSTWTSILVPNARIFSNAITQRYRAGMPEGMSKVVRPECGINASHRADILPYQAPKSSGISNNNCYIKGQQITMRVTRGPDAELLAA